VPNHHGNGPRGLSAPLTISSISSSRLHHHLSCPSLSRSLFFVFFPFCSSHFFFFSTSHTLFLSFSSFLSPAPAAPSFLLLLLLLFAPPLLLPSRLSLLCFPLVALSFFVFVFSFLSSLLLLLLLLLLPLLPQSPFYLLLFIFSLDPVSK